MWKAVPCHDIIMSFAQVSLVFASISCDHIYHMLLSDCLFMVILLPGEWLHPEFCTNFRIWSDSNVSIQWHVCDRNNYTSLRIVSAILLETVKEVLLRKIYVTDLNYTHYIWCYSNKFDVNKGMIMLKNICKIWFSTCIIMQFNSIFFSRSLCPLWMIFLCLCISVLYL